MIESAPMAHRRTVSLAVAALAALGLGACETAVDEAPAVDASAGEADAFPEPHDDIVEAIGGDATLEIAAWNIENFPKAERSPAFLADLITSLDLDLITVEEIASVEAWDELLARLPEHDGILSSHVYSATSYQKIGIVFREGRVAVDEVRLLFEDDTYAFPRPPLAARITVATTGEPSVFTVVGVHLKAGRDDADYERRTAAAIALDGWLRDFTETAADPDVVIDGDFNEVLDSEEGRAVLAPLLDEERYRFETAALADADAASFIPTGALIDHIVTTATFSAQLDGAVTVIPPLDAVPRYEPDLTDHLPVVVVLPLP
jgi:endonuclease/exonuclease/phosphatase family metal-dependent hydrolase